MSSSDDSRPQPIRCLYLHGFASGPNSTKASEARRRFARLGWELEVLDLNPPDFRDLTVGGMLETVRRAIDERNEPVALIGSSLGGYLAALIAGQAPLVKALVLLAPAFELRRRWSERLGEEALDVWKRIGAMLVYHYGRDERVPLSYRFFEESADYPEYPEVRDCSILVYHGRHDETVSIDSTERWVARSPGAVFHPLDDGHDLHASLPTILDGTIEFLAGC